MAGSNNFTGQNIQDTYQRVLQISSSGQLADGTGSLVPLLEVTASHAISASIEITKEVSSSYAETASMASDNFIVQGDITSSGNISASGYIVGSNVYVPTGGKIGLDGPSGNDFIKITAGQIDINRSNTQKLSIQSKNVVIHNSDLKVSGEITASGNISSSGTISADKFTSDGKNAIENSGPAIVVGNQTDFPVKIGRGGTTNIELRGPVTASGAISSSFVGAHQLGPVTIQNGDVTLDTNGTSYPLSSTNGILSVGHPAATFGTKFQNPVTASGDISASGEIFSGNRYYLNNRSILDYSSTNEILRLGYNNDTDQIGIGRDGVTTKIKLNAPVTASGDISASGNIINTGNITTNQITASGGIATNGDIVLENFTGTTSIRAQFDAFGLDDTIIAGVAGSQVIFGGDRNTILSGSTIQASADADVFYRAGDEIKFNANYPSDTPQLIINKGAITASLNISSSGNIIANHISASGDIVINEGNKLFFDGNDTAGLTPSNTYIHNAGTSDELEIYVGGTQKAEIKQAVTHFNNGRFKVTGNITASNDISASGNIRANLYASNGKSVAFSNAGTLTYGNASDNINVDGKSFQVLTNITASGDVSASGTATFGTAGARQTHTFFGRIRTVGSEVVIGDGHVTASGNISSSGTVTMVTASANHIITDGNTIEFRNTTGDKIGQLKVDDTTGFSFDVADGSDRKPVRLGDLEAKKINVTEITSSGNISASGNVYADRYLIKNIPAVGVSGTELQIGNANDWTSISYGRNTTDRHGFSGHITASGGISSSGTITANSITAGSLTLPELHLTKTGATSNEKLFSITSDSAERLSIDEDGDMSIAGKIEAGSDIITDASVKATGRLQTIIGSGAGLFYYKTATMSDLRSTIISDDGAVKITANGNNPLGQNYFVVSQSSDGVADKNVLVGIGAPPKEDSMVTIGGVVHASGSNAVIRSDSSITASIGVHSETGSFHVLRGKTTETTGLEVAGFISATSITASSGYTGLAGQNLSLKSGRVLNITHAEGYDVQIGGTNDDNVIMVEGNSATQRVTIGSTTHGLVVNSNITASNDISASGDVMADRYFLQGTRVISNSGNEIQINETTLPIHINGPSIGLQAPVTASGDISASGRVYSNNEQYWSTTGRLSVDDNTTNYFGPNPQGTNYYFWNRDLGTSATTITNKTNTLNTGWKLPYKAILTGYHLNIQGRSTDDNIEFTLVYSDGMWDGDVTSTSQTLVEAESAQEVNIAAQNNFYELDRRDQFHIPVSAMTMLYPRFKKTAATGGTTYDFQLAVQYRIVK